MELYNHHKVVEDFDDPTNKTRKLVTNQPNKDILYAREIIARNPKNEGSLPEKLTFMYYDFGDFKKWINVGDLQLTSTHWKLMQDSIKYKHTEAYKIPSSRYVN